MATLLEVGVVRPGPHRDSYCLSRDDQPSRLAPKSERGLQRRKRLAVEPYRKVCVEESKHCGTYKLQVQENSVRLPAPQRAVAAALGAAGV